MLHRLRNLFTIKNKFEAFLIIYGLGTGAVERGFHFMNTYPGWLGKFMFLLCPVAVFMAGGRILDSFEHVE